jgi:AraC family transcriptional regulator of adaptative response/methylated-DNA-[protein]-cysteine methyltransferase
MNEYRQALAQSAVALAAHRRQHAAHVHLEAATMQEMQAGGAGITLVVGTAASPFGPCLIAETARGICHLAFMDATAKPNTLDELRATWPQAELVRNDDQAARRAKEIFTLTPTAQPSAPWKVYVQGTAFQLHVWRTLLEVPTAELVSYGQLAAAAGYPRAARAIGNALAANPVAFLIPCHRVILASGHCGSYRWGIVRKQAMLAWERGTMKGRTKEHAG